MIELFYDENLLRLCVIMIHPSHPICSKTVENVDFKISGNCDRSDIVLSGKKKRGGKILILHPVSFCQL